MRIFGKSKAEKEEERRREEQRIQDEAKVAQMKIAYQKLVETVEKVKRLNPKWDIDDHTRGRLAGIAEYYPEHFSLRYAELVFSAISKFADGISIQISRGPSKNFFSGANSSYTKPASCSLAIKQDKTNGVDAFEIYNGAFSDGTKGFEHLDGYIKTIAKVFYEIESKKRKQQENQKQNIKNKFWDS